MSATLITKSDLAEVLFASALQESQHPSPVEIRLAVSRLMARDHGRERSVAYVAAEAGEHPETYVSRMRWALTAVDRAYADGYAVAA